MAKNKQQKIKERERRVAKKKLADAEKRRAQLKTASESQSSIPRSSKIMAAAIPKTDRITSNRSVSKKDSFTQRRSGG